MPGNEKNKSTTQMAIVLVCFAFSPQQAGADTWLEKAKLLASDGAGYDYFGYSVSVSGDYAIVGTTYGDGNAINSGSAYIFKRDGTSWSQQQKLLASDGAASDEFGVSVSISGDFAIVGADYDDSGKGSAYIFKRDGTSWSQQAKLTASDGAADDLFGYSVSISGDYAIVGADGDDSYKGSAYIFKRDGTSWSQWQKLLASDGAANDQFGFSISISGDLAIVGAVGDDSYKGSAYVFKRDGEDGETWSQQQKLTASSDGAANDWFGVSVSISGDLAIVGAFYDDDRGTDSGSAYIFKRDGTSWSLWQKRNASDGAAGDRFGRSVSISNDYAIVGAFGDDNHKGSAYIFHWNGTSWVQEQKLTASDGAAEYWFGISVSITSATVGAGSGDYAIVGAIGDNDFSGSAYVFKFSPSADLNGDCKVDFADFAIVADWWLYGTD
jgi:hypothetical protein